MSNHQSRNVSPAFYYHSRCWWRWRSNLMSFMHTFPWDYSTNSILFPFCYAGSQSSTVSHQLRTNQKDPSYPLLLSSKRCSKWYSLLDNISLPSLSQYKKQSFIHSFIHLDEPIPIRTYSSTHLFFHASHFLVMIEVAHSDRFAVIDFLRLNTSDSVLPFLASSKSLVHPAPLTRHRLLLLQLSLQIILPLNQLCLSRLFKIKSYITLSLRHRYFK